MHTIKITPNLLFEYQCTSGKFIRLTNGIETFFARIGMLYSAVRRCTVSSLNTLRKVRHCALGNESVPNRAGFKGAQGARASGSHQTVNILFLANEKCLAFEF